MPVPAWYSMETSASRFPQHTLTSKNTHLSTDLIRKSRYTAGVTTPTLPSTFASLSAIDPGLTTADRLVLHNLLGDVDPQASNPVGSSNTKEGTTSDHQTINELSTLSDPTNRHSVPAAFTTWDSADFPPWIRTYILQPYVAWACGVVRRPSDVVFLTYIVALFAFGVPNIVFLFLHFKWYRALFQWMLVTYLVGPYSILMHNHIHGRGVMRKRWALVDNVFPYMLGPIMGQTWNSFYYHHKHHHLEENGPDDLSSTLRYQRDSWFDLIVYLSRFVFLTWLELPLYYIRKGMLGFGLKFFAWEVSSYAFIALMARINFAATMTALVLPLIQWRIAVMVNNWGQHAFIDQDEPSSNLRCSITLIDVVVCDPVRHKPAFRLLNFADLTRQIAMASTTATTPLITLYLPDIGASIRKLSLR